LFVGLYRLAPSTLDALNHPASDAAALAPRRVSSLLALEIATARRSAGDTRGHPPADP
jgi:hypothetical protein